MKNKILTLLAIILLLAPLAFSQSRETGAIRGIITDDSGAPLPGVNVTLSGGNLMGVRTFVSDAKGEFRFPALPPGEYQVKAELQGFGTIVREKIRLTTTSTLAVDIQLKPATVAEEVTVIAQSPTVDVKSTETASVTTPRMAPVSRDWEKARGARRRMMASRVRILFFMKTSF